MRLLPIVVATLYCAWPIAAPAAGGWYLLWPPLSSVRVEDPSADDKVLNPNPMPKVKSLAPLAEWETHGSFDTAKECSGIKAYGSDSLGRQLIGIQEEQPRKEGWAQRMKKAELVYLVSLHLAVCVASDDPRLRR